MGNRIPDPVGGQPEEKHCNHLDGTVDTVIVVTQGLATAELKGVENRVLQSQVDASKLIARWTAWSSCSAIFVNPPRFLNFRWFRVLRVRMLLIQQDEVVQLEEGLNETDVNEGSALFFVSNHQDKKRRA